MSSPVTDADADATTPPTPELDEARLRLVEALDRVANLETALKSSRTIGTAVGILVERHRISPDEAFARIAAWSQRTHRKVSEIASDLVLTGEEPIRAA